MCYFDDQIYFQLENVFQLVQNERWRHMSVDEGVFCSIPDESNFELWVRFQARIQVLAYIRNSNIYSVYETILKRAGRTCQLGSDR